MDRESDLCAIVKVKCKGRAKIVIDFMKQIEKC